MPTPNQTPHHSRPDTDSIPAQLAALADTSWCPICDTVIRPAITGIANLVTHAASLCHEVTHVRLEAANLRAAIQAALHAADEGESDPLGYLRWELQDQPPSPDTGGRCA